MPAPKRPTPNHPLAQSAQEIEDDIAAALKVDALPEDPPAPPADPPAAVVEPTPAPPPAPAPPPEPIVDTRTQNMLDTMLGRVEAQNEEIRRLAAAVNTQDDNRAFLEKRNNELARQNAELQAQIDAGKVAGGFQSDLIDQQQFGEIYRGLQPSFKHINDQVASILARLNDTDKKVADAQAAPAVAIGKFRKEILDRTVRRGTPEFEKLLKNDKVFQDWLNERIPGSRTTRMQEVQNAWEQNDDEYFGEVVADYKKRGNPQPVPSADPPRAITEQQPKPPSEEPAITDEHLGAAFKQVLEGTMTRADYRKLDAAHKRQAPKPAR